MRKCLMVTLLSFLAGSVMQAQDVHFSQFYYSPFTLNPALAGGMDGTFRFSGIYRHQWSVITSPFVYLTPSISGDVKLFSGGRNNNYLGIGMLLQNDRSADGGLSNITQMFSLAYHQVLDRDGNYHLAVGMQGGMVQKSIDFTKLNNAGFTQQFNYQTSYMDIGAGVALDGVPNNHIRFQIGASLFHLNRPGEKYFDNDNRLDMRFVAHGSLTLRAGKKLYFFPLAEFQSQNNYNELEYGSNFGFNISKSGAGTPCILYLGALNRLGHDIIPTAGIMIKGIHAGLSYDANISTDELADVRGRGAFELALSYTGSLHCQNLTSVFWPSF